MGDATVTRERCGACEGEGVEDCTECGGSGYIEHLVEPPEEHHPESKNAEPSPFVRAMFEAMREVGSEATEEIICMVCRQKTPYPKYLVEMVRKHNRREFELAAATEKDPYPHQAQFVSSAQIGCCAGECELKYRAHLEAQAQHRLRSIDDALLAAREGRLSWDGRGLLLREGYRSVVDDYDANQQSKEGQST